MHFAVLCDSTKILPFVFFFPPVSKQNMSRGGRGGFRGGDRGGRGGFRGGRGGFSGGYNQGPPDSVIGK